MTWQGSTTTADKVFATLPYLLPLSDAVRTGIVFLSFLYQFPALRPIVEVFALLARPATFIEGALPFGSFIVFILLILLVVRNPNISRFIRFNTLQAILLGFMIAVCNLVLGLLAPLAGLGLITETLSNVIFLGGMVAVVYSMVQSLRGQYSEIPTISEAVHMQLR